MEQQVTQTRWRLWRSGRLLGQLLPRLDHCPLRFDKPLAGLGPPGRWVATRKVQAATPDETNRTVNSS